MGGILVEIPEDLAKEFKGHEGHLREILLLGLRQLKIQEALWLYREGVVSLGRAAAMAGLPIREMVRQAIAWGIKPQWSEEMVEEELA